MPSFDLMEARMIVFMAMKEEQMAIAVVRSFNSPGMGSTTAVDYVVDRS